MQVLQVSLASLLLQELRGEPVLQVHLHEHRNPHAPAVQVERAEKVGGPAEP